MGYLSTKERLLQPSRSRLIFLILAVFAFGITEIGRFVYRPFVRQNGVNDLGLADCIGNLGGIGVQIFLGLAVLNSTRQQSYRMAVFFTLGYIVYEFAQPYLPKGVFDWLDIYATVVGFAISAAAISIVWKAVGPEQSLKSGGETGSGTIA